MPTSMQLREQRASIWEQMKEVMERADSEGRELSGEERAKYDKAEVDLDRLGDDIARQERFEGRDREFSKIDRSNAPGEVAEQAGESRGYNEAFTAWMRGGTEDLSSEQRKVLRTGWVDGRELRAQGVATPSAGGYTVPAEFRAKVVEKMNFVASMRQLAEVISTDSGANLPWPTNDDTANEGAILDENTQVTEQDVTFGTASLDSYMYTSKLVRVSYQLLNDSAFALDSWLARVLGERIGRIQNKHFTIGAGTTLPDGIVTSSTVGKQGTTGQTTSIIYEDLVDLTDSLDPAYLAGDVRFMMSQGARKMVRKLKDTAGRPLWEPSLQIGTPDTLLGYGVALNNYVPVPAASAKSILFGDFREAYVIRDVSDFQLLRLTERYADYLQVGFLGFQRSDGTLQNGAAVRAYQHSAA